MTMREVEIWLVNWQDADQRLLLRKGNIGEVSPWRIGFLRRSERACAPARSAQGPALPVWLRCGAGRWALRRRSGRSGLSRRRQRRSRSRTIAGFRSPGLDGFAEGWFARGRLTWTTGANSGRAMEVKFHRVGASGVAIELWREMSAPIAPGDSFVITAGCDKQFSTCRAKFDNAENFRGFPHMPGNDFVASYPNRDDGEQ